MVLTLEVIGEQAEGLGAAARKVFHAIGGTIGRLPDNDWVFPDSYVSGRHALIRYLNGKYFIEDTSTNGVYVNSRDNRISRTEAHQLKDGDLLYLDAYQIRVSIRRDDAAKDDPFARLGGARAKATPSQEDRTASLVMPEADDRTEWFGMREASNPEPPRPRLEAVRPSSRSTPPAARTVPDSDAENGARPARGKASSDPAAHFETLLAAAGVAGLKPSEEAAQTLGEVLRIAFGGVMDMLRARERMKAELRMRGTAFKPAHNNPLKFSANVEDAFHNLLVKRNPAYLGPAQAFEEAFRDVRNHQAATLAAMRVAFEATLAEFDPDRLHDEFERQMKKSSILGAPAKMRYWDLYRDRYGALSKDADSAFRNLFGEEFAQAYEQQLERLRNQGGSRET